MDDDDELNELRVSIQRLEGKVDRLLAQPKRRVGFAWKELIVGFIVTYIVMMVLLVTIGVLNQHFSLFH